MAKAYMTYDYEYKIGETEDELFVIGEGIEDVSYAANEDSDEFAYLANKGVKEVVPTGSAPAWTFSGHRFYGDEAQELVIKKMFTPNDRTVFYEITRPDDTVLSGQGSLSEITAFNGAADSREEFSFTLNASEVKEA